MADPRVELRQVKSELDSLEDQLSHLLDRQQMLRNRRRLLERAIRDASATTEVAVDKWDSTEFPWSSKVSKLMKSVFKVDKLRPLQLETINATLSGKDCILIMPTGGGKSLCYQLPALISKGVTLVVCPLVSLMEDQLMALRSLNVPADLLTASSDRDHVARVHSAMTDPAASLRLLYVTPEKLAKSKRFVARLEKMAAAGRFARLAVDEVHCCSQWGHDFRPDYKFLGVMRRQFPAVPFLGLTATATNSVMQDVKKILQVDDCVLFRASFNRKNLFYEVRPKPAKLQATMDEIVKLINSRFKNQSGIVYCLSQKDTEEVTRSLRERHIAAGCYHANMSADDRSAVHRKWTTDQIQVVVATIAFGMGIDKADVRFVIHHSISKSMENYYQESGRAGRDDKRASCILYVQLSDVFRQSVMVFTEQTGLEKLYAMLEYAYELRGCRRDLIARHFGERWDTAECNESCDHCHPEYNASPPPARNVCPYARALVRLLGHARNLDQRLTAGKLLDAWTRRGGSPALRLDGVCSPLDRVECERVLVCLLLKGYLKEDFHFTPYTTISYIVAGPAASLLDSPTHNIEMCINATPGGSGGKSSAKSVKVSKTKSSTSSDRKTPSDSKSTKISSMNNEDSVTEERPQRKRKLIIVNDDSDDDDDPDW